MMAMMFILDENHKPVGVTDIKEWAEWMTKNNSARRVDFTRLGKYTVSTVFTGMRTGMRTGDLFETKVFKNGLTSDGEYTKKYSSWEQAFNGHKKIVESLSFSLNSPKGFPKYE